jgi:uncharacterized membrane protein YhhN
MRQFFKDLFSTSNEINEHTIVGFFFIAVFLAMLAVDAVLQVDFSGEKYYIVAGLIAASFGFGSLKR